MIPVGEPTVRCYKVNNLEEAKEALHVEMSRWNWDDPSELWATEDSAKYEKCQGRWSRWYKVTFQKYAVGVDSWRNLSDLSRI